MDDLDLRYCIKHGQVDRIYTNLTTGGTYHLTFIPDFEYCDGPFSFSSPPDDLTEEMWDAIMADDAPDTVFADTEEQEFLELMFSLEEVGVE